MGKVTTRRYIRKPLYVDAVRITTGNFDAIVSWCQGEVARDEVPGEGTSKPYIKVRVHNPKNPRQTKAFVGDWLLYTERGYKVYTNKAFHASFDLAEEEQQTPAQQERLESIDEQVRNGSGIVGAGAIKEVDGKPVEEIHHRTPDPVAIKKAEVAKGDLWKHDTEMQIDPRNLEPVYDVEADVRQQMDEGFKEQMGAVSDEEVAQAIIEHPEGREITDVTLHSVGPVIGDPDVDEGVQPMSEILVVEVATPESIAQAVQENEAARQAEATVPQPVVHRDADLKTVEDVAEQEKIVPAAAEGKRILSVEEQEKMGADEVRALIQAGEVVLAQDIAQP